MRPEAPSDTPSGRPAGLVLAAGAGRRFGGPKALARDADGTPWVAKAVAALRAGGCEPVIVVLGAGADEASPLVPPDARIVRTDRWSEGVAASLRAGLEAAASLPAPAVVIIPVDTPELPAAAVSRLAERAAPDALASADYRGEPGHPVLIGRGHWSALAAAARGDIGARPYLRAHGAEAVECGDLWSGTDRDVR